MVVLHRIDASFMSFVLGSSNETLCYLDTVSYWTFSIFKYAPQHGFSEINGEFYYACVDNVLDLHDCDFFNNVWVLGINVDHSRDKTNNSILASSRPGDIIIVYYF